MAARIVRLLAVITVAGLAPLSGELHAQDAYPWSDLAFLTGCWSGTMGSLDMREQWTEAEGGVMLGTTRYYREGRLADFEFAMISEIDGSLTLWPYPGGTRSPRGFPLVRWGGELVFENLQHDFPVRIVYPRDEAGILRPRIEGRDGSSRGWELTRVECPD
jgi:hypothetical protein